MVQLVNIPQQLYNINNIISMPPLSDYIVYMVPAENSNDYKYTARTVVKEDLKKRLFVFVNTVL